MSTERNRRKRKKKQVKRLTLLQEANKAGWKQCNEYHYQKTISGKLVNWWPSTSKCMIDNQVYRVFEEADMTAIIETLAQ
jgi:hypothetical protein